MATAKKSTGTKKKTAAKSAASSNQGGGKSASAKTGGAKKSTAAKSSSASRTGASKSAGTAKKATSKGSAAKSSTASKRGGSKTTSANKSGAAGKRSASGGAKSSGRSATAKKTASKSTTKTGGGRSTPAKKTTAARTKNTAPAKKSAAKSEVKKTVKRTAAKSNGSANKKATSKRAASNGIVKKVSDAMTSLFGSAKPNAVDLLKADHKKVEGFFEKVKANEDGNNRDVFKNIKFELDAHAHIEEKIFYPYLLEKGDEELQKIVREGIEEHRQAKLFLVELDDLDGDNDRFKAKIKVLMEDIEHHVKEEEDEMFPLVEDQIDAEKLESMGEQMEREKSIYQERMPTPPKLTGRAASGSK